MLSLIAYSFAQQPSYKSSFNKDNLSHKWNAQYKYSGIIQNTKLDFQLLGNSRLYKNSQKNSYANDNLILNSHLNRKFNNLFTLTSNLNGKFYNNENINLTYHQIEYFSKLKFSVSPGYSISPILGSIYDYKFNIHDPGLIYGLQLNAININTTNNTSVKTDYNTYFYDYKERKNRKHQFNLDYNTKFSKLAKDSLFFGYSKTTNNEYYKNTFNNNDKVIDNVEIEKIDIEEITLSNNIEVKLKNNIFFSNRTQFKKRNFSQKKENKLNRRNETQLFNVMNIFSVNNKTLWKLSVLNSLQINDFSLSISNNNKLQFAINNRLNYRINPKQKLEWLFSYSKYEYNTPDSLKNFDDRDELRFYNLLKYKIKLNKRLQWEIYTGQKYFHQIFIFSEKSGLNKEEKILDLGTDFIYRYGNLKNNMGGEISSYYLTYDFDKKSNLVNRKLSLKDTINYKIFSQTYINLIAKYEIEELGNLDWKNFKEQITRENHYNYYIIYLFHKMTNLIFMKPGFNYIVRNDFVFSDKKNKIRTYRSKSFWFETIWNFSNKGYVSGRINKFLDKDTKKDWKSYFRGNLEVVWFF